jgi:hypothetical protein
MNPVVNPESISPFAYGSSSATRSFQWQQTSAGSVSLEQNTDVTRSAFVQRMELASETGSFDLTVSA